MKVLVAPDSFKGTLTAPQAAEAIARGWKASRPQDVIDLCPLSDGGDGLVGVALGLGSWDLRRTIVTDPFGRPVEASYAINGDDALVESAEACGLQHLTHAELDPLRADTRGVGLLLEDARLAGGVTISVGLGGSATVDGGIGMLSALGFDALDERGRSAGDGPRGLERAATIRVDPASPWLGSRLRVLSDVGTTLVDSARVFGPQKGADDAAVKALTRGLDRWADIVESTFGRPGLRFQPGTGAAGGLGFALAALGADVTGGAEYVSTLVDLESRIARADVVVVGEGQLDATSFDGKVVGSVLRIASHRGVPVSAVVGRAAASSKKLMAIAEASAQDSTWDHSERVAMAAEDLARRMAGVPPTRIRSESSRPSMGGD